MNPNVAVGKPDAEKIVLKNTGHCCTIHNIWQGTDLVLKRKQFHFLAMTTRQDTVDEEGTAV